MQQLMGNEYGSFRPYDKITREQGIEIIAKAMKITNLAGITPTAIVNNTLQPFKDVASVSESAKSSMVDAFGARVFLLFPKNNTNL